MVWRDRGVLLQGVMYCHYYWHRSVCCHVHMSIARVFRAGHLIVGRLENQFIDSCYVHLGVPLYVYCISKTMITGLGIA